MSWNHILDNMGKFSMNDFHLRDVFYRKIKDEPEMEFDVKNYERMSENDPFATCEHLRNYVQKVITMQEQKKNLADREALLVARDIRRDNKITTAVPAKANASSSKNNIKRMETSDKALKTEQTIVEVTPNAKAKKWSFSSVWHRDESKIVGTKR
jgi:hypothetical protein